jgi:hypothetical protein
MLEIGGSAYAQRTLPTGSCCFVLATACELLSISSNAVVLLTVVGCLDLQVTTRQEPGATAM